MNVYIEANGKVTITKNYYILSQQFSTEHFKEITREHWRLDVILDEDHSTNKKDNFFDNLALIRKMSLILCD